MREFRKWLAEEGIEQEFTGLSGEEARSMMFELEKLRTRAGQLLKRLKEG